MQYNALIEECRPYWLSIAKKITGSIEDAEDAVQNALVRWLTLAEDRQIEHPRAYLTRAVVTQSLNLKDWLKIRQTQEINDQTIDAQQNIDSAPDLDVELSNWLTHLTSRLTPIEQGVLIMKDVLQLSYEDIAANFDRNVDYCRQIISRARQNAKNAQPRFQVCHLQVDELKKRLLLAVERDAPAPLLDWYAAR
jgi:RNA polymerase sigma-70 factor, ECF subfamily